jgi:hypothetical protein
MFTPNGRFEVNKKICLTTSGFHQDQWVAAAWNLTTLLQGFASIWHSDITEDKIINLMKEGYILLKNNNG